MGAPELATPMRRLKFKFSLSSAPAKIEQTSQKIALLPIAPKFGTHEVNTFGQSQTEFHAIEGSGVRVRNF